MATKLDNDVIRESSVLADDREILIRLNTDQTVSMKLKGMKSGTVSISILDLWNQLNGTDTKPKQGPIATVRKQVYKDDLMVSVQKLRSLNAVTHSDLAVTIKLDEIFSDLLKGKIVVE
jgi:hypothetical protein